MRESDPRFGREVDRFVLGAGFWKEEAMAEENTSIAPVGSSFDLDVRRRAQEAKVKADAILAVADSVEVKDDEDYKLAVEIGKKIKLAIKELAGSRDFVLKPVKLAVRDYEEMFKQISMPLEEGERSIKRKLLRFEEIRAEERRKEEMKAREEAAKRQRELEEEARARAAAAREAGQADMAHRIETSVPVVAVPMPEPAPEAPGASTVEEWKYEILNPEVIPREYWILDEKMIGKVVRNMKDKTNIPGIRVYPEKNIRLYSGR